LSTDSAPLTVAAVGFNPELFELQRNIASAANARPDASWSAVLMSRAARR